LLKFSIKLEAVQVKEVTPERVADRVELLVSEPQNVDPCTYNSSGSNACNTNETSNAKCNVVDDAGKTSRGAVVKFETGSLDDGRSVDGGADLQQP
jgi:hypothetical protein